LKLVVIRGEPLEFSEAAARLRLQASYFCDARTATGSTENNSEATNFLAASSFVRTFVQREGASSGISTDVSRQIFLRRPSLARRRGTATMHQSSCKRRAKAMM